MAVNGFNVGRDYTAFLYDANTATIVDLGIIEDIKIQVLKSSVKVTPYNDTPKYGYIPDGYSGTFTLARKDSKLEDLMIGLDTLFNNGGSILPGYIQEVWSNNADGSISRYQYTGVVFTLTSVADVRRDGKIAQNLAFQASDKVPVA